MDIFIADSFVNRFLGYMFRKRPHHDIIIFTHCNSIHTFFMKFNIDVYFIDENCIVTKIIRNLKPGRIVLPVRGAKKVIETKVGIFHEIDVGDKIEIN